MPLVYLPALLMGTSAGLSMPLVMAILGSEVPPGQRGVAMGLRTGANQAGLLLSPMAMGLLVSSLGVPLGFVGSSVFSAAVIAAAVWVHLRAGAGPPAGQDVTVTGEA